MENIDKKGKENYPPTMTKTTTTKRPYTRSSLLKTTLPMKRPNNPIQSKVLDKTVTNHPTTSNNTRMTSSTRLTNRSIKKQSSNTPTTGVPSNMRSTMIRGKTNQSISNTTKTVSGTMSTKPIISRLSRSKTTQTNTATKRTTSNTTIGNRNTTVNPVGKRTTVSNSRVTSEPGKRASWDIRGKYSDLQKAYNDIQKEHENQINELKKEKELIEEQSLISLSKVKQLEGELDSANSTINSLKSEIISFPEKLLEKDKRINELLDEISEKQVIIENLSDENSQLTLKCDHIKCKYKILKSNYKIIEKNSNEIQCELQKKEELLNEAKKDIERLEQLLIESKKQLGKQDLERRYLHHKMMELKGTVRVACRVRPVLPNEQNATVYLIEYSSTDSTMKIMSTQSKDSVTGEKVDSIPYYFKFDNFFGAHASQKNVFDEIEPLIQSALDGYNVCIFAYGQTGSGKTFTMEGCSDTIEKHGMIPRSVNKIFESMAPMERNGWNYKVYVSFIEIYNETLRDLLGTMDEKTGAPKAELKIYQPTSNTLNSGLVTPNKVNDVEITNLKIVQVQNPKEVHDLLAIAHKNRTVGATKCNISSSRSHSVFQLKLVGTNEILKESSIGKINLVDLAGSERLKESKVEGVRLVETKHINKSLSTLRKVMQSLSDKESHVPFRDSKLTHLLQTSLGGNSKSLMFVNISPLEEHFSESINSLRFAAKVNEVHIGVATQNKKKVAY